MCSFAAIGLVLFFAFDTVRKYIPDDKQQLEYKVRLKYKLNEKYQELVTKSPEGKPGMLVSFIQKQVDPLMDKVNQLLELDRKQTDQFLQDRSSHFGGDNKILGYFEANQNTRRYGAAGRLGYPLRAKLCPSAGAKAASCFSRAKRPCT